MIEHTGRCLIVEDDTLIALYLSTLVSDWGYEVCGTARSADEAVELARLHEPEWILMDLRLDGERDGVDAGREIRRDSSARIIYITGSQEPESIERIKQESPFLILAKPIEPSDLRTALAS